MESERHCPPHIGTGLTPTDSTCHGHQSGVQQFFHNLHCRLLGCLHALRGTMRHEDAPVLPPRNWVERRLYALDVLRSEDDSKESE